MSLRLEALAEHSSRQRLVTNNICFHKSSTRHPNENARPYGSARITLRLEATRVSSTSMPDPMGLQASLAEQHPPPDGDLYVLTDLTMKIPGVQARERNDSD